MKEQEKIPKKTSVKKLEELEKLIEESQAYVGRILENEAFIGSVGRFIHTSYTDPNIALLFKALEKNFGKAIVLEKEYKQIIHKENQKSEASAVIAYETTNNIINDISNITSIRLDNRQKEYPKEKKPTSINLLKEFLREYKEADREGLITSTQRVINYTAEHFNGIRNKSEQNIGTYHFKIDIFDKQKKQGISIGSVQENKKQITEENTLQTYISPYDFTDVIGLEEQKENMRIRLFNPLRETKKWEELKKDINKTKNKFNFIFYGPPGAGKTYFAKAIAGELGIPFYLCNGSDFIQPHLGEGKNIINEVYQEAEKQKNAIIYIDEADTILGKRGTKEAELKRDVLNSILTAMDGGKLKGNTITGIGTNRYEDLDEALISRIPKTNRIYFGPMDEETKKQVILFHLQQYKHEEFNTEKMNSIMKNIGEESMRGISDIAREAAYQALNNKHEGILYKDVERAIQIYQEG